MSTSSQTSSRGRRMRTGNGSNKFINDTMILAFRHKSLCKSKRKELRSAKGQCESLLWDFQGMVEKFARPSSRSIRHSAGRLFWRDPDVKSSTARGFVCGRSRERKASMRNSNRRGDVLVFEGSNSGLVGQIRPFALLFNSFCSND